MTKKKEKNTSKNSLKNSSKKPKKTKGKNSSNNSLKNFPDYYYPKVVDSEELSSDITEYFKVLPQKSIIVMIGPGATPSVDFRSETFQMKHNLPDQSSIYNLEFFKNDPEPFYTLAKEILTQKINPTEAHYFIKLLHEKGLLRRCYTQNIDSLEKIAGIPDDMIVPVNGNLETATVITGPRTGEKVPIEEVNMAIKNSHMNHLNEKYGGLVKHDITLIGERNPEKFLREYKSDFERTKLLIVIGPNMIICPFASLITLVSSNCRRILVNPEIVGLYVPTCSRTLGAYITEGFDFSEGLNFSLTIKKDSFFKGVVELAKCLGLSL